MKVIKLEAQNVKRLRAISITPTGAAVVIGGMNGQGKTSVLDAIEYALAGKRALPERPVRDGEDIARVVCELDGLTVRRVIGPDGSSLVVTDENGDKVASPQKVLDRMVGAISFDPLEFVRMNQRDQVRALEGVIGVNVSAMDAQRKAVFEQRADLNRELRRLEGLTSEEPPVPVAVAVDPTALYDELERTRGGQGCLDEAQRAEREAARYLHDAEIDMTKAEAEVERLRRALEEAEHHVLCQETTVTAARAMVVQREEQSAGAAAALGTMRAVEAIRADLTQLTLAQREGEAARVARAAYDQAVTSRERARTDAAALSETLAHLDDGRAQHVAQAVAGINLPGLGISETGVTWNGVPLAQCSSAEQLRVAVGVGLAANPEIRVVLIREGALLDDQSLAIVAGMAAAADAQVWVERVGEGAECSVVIEDGAVKGVQP